MMRLGPAGRPLALLLSCLLATASPWAGAADNAVDFEDRVIRMVLPQEPPQLDSSKATDQVSTRVLGHVMEALTRFDGQGRLVPGVAERWEIRSDGATFWLRENARWSDGSPVTAADFVFSWRHAVDPKTASEYAFILQGIENAEAISQGEAPTTSLGVSAPEPRRLEVRFSRALAYFDKLVAFATFYPLKESFYRSRDGRYGADAEDMLFNGPFVIERWAHGARLEMAKNPHYWDRDNIYLNRIEFPYITADTNAALNLFKDNRIILAGLDSETMENALDQRWRIERFNDGSAWYIEFNHREGRLTQNWHLRRALALRVHQSGDRHPGQPSRPIPLPLLSAGGQAAPASGNPAAGAGDGLDPSPEPSGEGHGRAGPYRTSGAGSYHGQLPHGEQAGGISSNALEGRAGADGAHRPADLQATPGQDDRRGL